MGEGSENKAEWAQAWIDEQREKLRRSAETQGTQAAFAEVGSAWQVMGQAFLRELQRLHRTDGGGAAHDAAGDAGDRTAASHEAQQPFASMFDPLAASAIPPLGGAREHQQVWRDLAAAQAEYQARERELLAALFAVVSPVDFRTPDNLLTKWSDGVDIDALVDTLGNVPGEMLNTIFLALMPFRLLSQKYVSLIDQAGERAALENFVRMEKWIFDSPDQPGEMFRQFLNELVKQNRLVEGGLEIGGRPIDLRQIKVPVLNIYAQRDHLVPPSSSRPLKGLVGTRDYTEYAFPGGHIGIYVSAAAQREVPGRIAEWLKRRTALGGRD